MPVCRNPSSGPANQQKCKNWIETKQIQFHVEKEKWI
jgi:hypothetical protein